ncbi:DegT/DnrJ/EryC1/StrS family aminotransferase [Candidatus Kuenenbacteria bacterium]|nr:DegT/DnrJ/EryC1/StrS family aminotransferase [Candidatus Kuenenbacteria bacterium]
MSEINKIRLSKSVVGKDEADAVSKIIIENGYLGMGAPVQEFENKIQAYLKTDNKVICVNSGTAALHLALMSLNLDPGDEVLVQSLTFAACFQAISAAGLKPIPCEIYPETCTIDLQDAEKRITKKTKAIMPIHYASRTGDLDKIYEFAKKHNLRVIEDAAHAFGTICKEKKVGSLGDITCFSFDGIKNITSGEGGAIVTKDPAVIQYCQDARLLGIQKDTEKRVTGNRSWEFDIKHQGYRFHMSNIFAAIGLVQLSRLDNEFKPKRQQLATQYYSELQNITKIQLFENDFDRILPHIFPIRILNSKRDALRQHLLENNIECGIHYYPNHLLSYFKVNNERLSITEEVYSQLLSLPLHPEITNNQQEFIINKIKQFFI